MAESPPRVLLVDGWIAPYRLAVFDRIGQEVDLTVLFCEPSPNASYLRHYTEPSFDAYAFSGAVLRYVGLNSFSLGYSLPAWLARPYDVYIVKDEPRFVLNTGLLFLASRIFRKPFVLWSEVIETKFSSGQVPTRKRLYRIPMPTDFVIRYRRAVYRRMDGCVANSSKARDFVLDRGANPGKVISGGQVMPEDHLPEPVEPEDPPALEDRHVVLYVGYFLERKGVDVLLDAVRRLDDDRYLVLLAGSGPLEEELRRCRGDTESIQFLGFVEGVEKAWYYRKADVTVLPTLHDPWGLVVNESVHYGTPAITTDEAGAADLLEEEGCGLVVPAGDADALADALNSFFTDDRLRARLECNAAETRRCHDVDYAAGVFLEAVERFSARGG